MISKKQTSFSKIPSNKTINPKSTKVEFPSTFKILLLGGAIVGQSNLTLKFAQGNFYPDYDPIIEDN